MYCCVLYCVLLYLYSVSSFLRATAFIVLKCRWQLRSFASNSANISMLHCRHMTRFTQNKESRKRLWLISRLEIEGQAHCIVGYSSVFFCIRHILTNVIQCMRNISIVYILQEEYDFIIPVLLSRHVCHARLCYYPSNCTFGSDKSSLVLNYTRVI